jgi:hypothetical protein
MVNRSREVRKFVVGEPFVEAFRIALLGDRERRVHKHLQELVARKS